MDRLALGVVLALLMGCNNKIEPKAIDADEDGVVAGEDCDDSRANVYPGADEVCDGLDNDCDGVIDEDADDAITYYWDGDSDRYGDRGERTRQCGDAPTGYTDNPSDCDDDDPTVNPGQAEVCGDAIDNDCDGLVDDICDTAEGSTGSTGSTASTADTSIIIIDPPTADTATFASGSTGNTASTADTSIFVETGIVDTGIVDTGTPPLPIVEHCGAISVDTTWDASDAHHVTCDVFVEGAGAPTLTIADATLVAFAPGAGLFVGVNDGGKLVVQGAGSGVSFATDQGTAGPGQWDGLTFGPGDTGSSVEGLTLTDAGVALAAVVINSASPDLSGCTISDNSFAGIAVSGSTARPTISGTAISGNAGTGLNISAGAGLGGGDGSFSNNTISGNAGVAVSIPAPFVGSLDASSAYSGNTTDAIVVLPGTIATTTTWQDLRVPLQVSGTVLVQDPVSSASLTLASGVTAAFGAVAGLEVGSSNPGNLTVSGNVSLLAQGSSWPGLYLGPLASASLNGLSVDSGGSNGQGGITINSSSPVLAACTVSNSVTHGIYATGAGARPAISGCVVTGSAQDGVHITSSAGLDSASTPGFAGNVLTGNGGYPMSVPVASLGELDTSSTFSPNSDNFVRVWPGNVGANATWHSLDVPFWVSGVVTVGDSVSAPVLTIEDGARFVFEAAARLDVGSLQPGQLLVNAPSGISMDGVSATPGAWGGVVFGPLDSGSTVVGLSVSNAGAAGQGAVVITNSAPSLAGLTVDASYAAGVYVSGGAARPLISDSSLIGNLGDGLHVVASSGLGSFGGSPSVTQLLATGNAGYAVSLPGNFVWLLDASDTLTPNTSAHVRVFADTISDSGAWQKLDADYLVTGTLTVQDAVSAPVLSLLDNVVVHFASNTGLDVGTSYPGQLLVDAASGVLLDGLSLNPGAWRGLSFGAADAGSSLRKLTVAYAGANSNSAITVTNAAITLDQSAISFSAGDGLYANGGAARLALSGNTITDNAGDGVSLAGGAGLATRFDSNTVIDNGGYPIRLLANDVGMLDSSSVYTPNGSDLIYVLADTVEDTQSWQALDADYYMAGSVTVQDASKAPTLTLEGGANYRFATNMRLEVGTSYFGKLLAEGGVAPISMQPHLSTGAWGGLSFGSQDGGSSLTGLTISRGGANGNGNIALTNAAVRIDGCTLTESVNHGVYVNGGSAVLELLNSTVISNAKDGVYLTTSARLGGPFANNSVTDNADYPVSLGPNEVQMLRSSSRYTPNGSAWVRVWGGTVSDSGSWSDLAVPYYVDGEVYVQDAVNAPLLTLEDGVQARWRSNFGLSVGSSYAGGLEVLGGAKGVVLDRFGATGAWDGVSLMSQSLPSTLTGLTLDHAGANGSAALYLVNASPLVSKATILNATNHGLSVSGASAMPIITDTTIDGSAKDGVYCTGNAGLGGLFARNTVRNNGGYPVTVYPNYVDQLDASSSYTPNSSDYARVWGGTLGHDAVWQGLDVPYYVDGEVYVQDAVAAPRLTLGAGAQFLFKPNFGLSIASSYPGSLAGGSGVSMGRFGASGFWDGVTFGSQDTGSALSGLSVTAAGANGLGSVVINSASPTFAASQIIDGSTAGIYINGGPAQPIITGTTVSGHAGDGVRILGNGGLGGVFSGNSVQGNGGYAVVLYPKDVRWLDPGGVYSPNGSDYVMIHSGTLGQTGTWSTLDAPYYVDGEVYVQDAVNAPALTLADGARLEFRTNFGLQIGLSYPGSLVIDSTNKVTLTARGVGNWDGITFGSQDVGSSLRGLDLSQAGANGVGGVAVNSASPRITESSISGNLMHGVSVSGTAAAPIIQTTTLNNNAADGLYLAGGAHLGGVFIGNTVQGNGGYGVTLYPQDVGLLDVSSSYSPNGSDRVRLWSGTVSSTQSWSALDAPYYLDGEVYIQDAVAGPVVTIADGAQFYVRANFGLSVGVSYPGSVVMAGGGSGILWTRSGASNWDGLTFGSQDQGSSLSLTTVELAGANGQGGLVANSASPSFDQVTVQDCTNHGVAASGASAAPTITGSLIRRNLKDGVSLSGGAHLGGAFSGNTVQGNGNYALTVYPEDVRWLDGAGVYSPNTMDRVRVLTGSVSTSGIWDALDADYYFDGEVYIQQATTGVSVTLQDGLRARFRTNFGLSVGVSYPGDLQVAAPATGVTLLHEGSVGQWDGVTLGSQDNGSSLSGLSLLDAGANGSASVFISSSSPSLDGVVVTGGSRDGVRVSGGAAKPSLQRLTVSGVAGDGLAFVSTGSLTGSLVGSSFTACGGVPVRVYANDVGKLDAAGVYSGNSGDFVSIYSSTVSTTQTWPALDVPLRATGEITVGSTSSPTLTLADGVRLEFATNFGMNVGPSQPGALVAVAGAKGIVFTSTSLSSTWDGLTLSSACVDAGTLLDGVVVERGGANGSGNVYFYACNGTIRNSTLRDGTAWGLACGGAATPARSGNSYLGNVAGTTNCP